MLPNRLTIAWLVAANASAASTVNSTRPTGEAMGTSATATRPSSSAAWTSRPGPPGPGRTAPGVRVRPAPRRDRSAPAGRVSSIINVPIHRARPRTTGTSPAATVLGFCEAGLDRHRGGHHRVELSALVVGVAGHLLGPTGQPGGELVGTVGELVGTVGQLVGAGGQLGRPAGELVGGDRHLVDAGLGLGRPVGDAPGAGGHLDRAEASEVAARSSCLAPSLTVSAPLATFSAAGAIVPRPLSSRVVALSRAPAPLSIALPRSTWTPTNRSSPGRRPRLDADPAGEIGHPRAVVAGTWPPGSRRRPGRPGWPPPGRPWRGDQRACRCDPDRSPGGR